MTLRKILIAAFVLMSLDAAAADIRVVCTGATKSVVETLARQFEAASGHKISLVADTAGGVTRRIEAGEAYDVVVIVPRAIEDLIAKGRLAPGSRVDVATVGMGVGIREGAPRPDISSVEAFIRSLRAAKSIAYVDPAAGGTSGIYFRGWLEKNGLAAEMAPKTKLKAGGYVAELVANGEAEMAIHQISEILPVKGVSMIGPLPEGVQLWTTYTAGLAASPRDAAAAKAFHAHVSGPSAASVIRAAGMEPGGRN